MPKDGMRNVSGGAESATTLFQTWDSGSQELDLSDGDRASGLFTIVVRGESGGIQYACNCDGRVSSNVLTFTCPFSSCHGSGNYTYSIQDSELKLCQASSCQTYR